MHDPRVLRAIAHPTRGRILDELGATGPMRAADVGAALDIPANQASFHLRQLAKYGLIEPAPGGGARQARPGLEADPTSVASGRRADEIEKQPGGKAAVSVFRRSAAAWAHRLVDEVFSSAREDEHLPRDRSTRPMKLTKDEAAEFMGEVDEVLATWAARRGGATRERPYLCLLLDAPALPRGRREDDVIRWGSCPPDSAPPIPPPWSRRWRASTPASADPADLRLLTKHFLALLDDPRARARRSRSGSRRTPRCRCVAGVRHTRGTPPAVVEMDAATWIALATGDLDWAEAEPPAGSAPPASAPT